jgi:hypothetical protein
MVKTVFSSRLVEVQPVGKCRLPAQRCQRLISRPSLISYGPEVIYKLLEFLSVLEILLVIRVIVVRQEDPTVFHPSGVLAVSLIWIEIGVGVVSFKGHGFQGIVAGGRR